jgi:4-hydroxy-tetrahydrodipicolinate synthase
MFRGVYTALVTPFRDGSLDEPAFRALIEDQIAAGVTGIVPVGTTGESPTLSHAEHERVIGLAVEYAARRCQVVAGTGSNSTAEAVDLTRAAARLGADGALLVVPYYNKPSQEGVFRHYREVARATPLPLVLYSIPGRSGIEIGVDTVARLAAECPTILAIKESGGNVERVSQLRQVLPEVFTVLSGDDSLTLPFLAAGAVGVVSVASNLIPSDVVALVAAFTSGDAARARAIHQRLYPLFKDLFIEPNPVPVKTALAALGRMSAEVRLPLCEMSRANADRLMATLRSLNLPVS